jgi:hypothetical protein
MPRQVLGEIFAIDRLFPKTCCQLSRRLNRHGCPPDPRFPTVDDGPRGRATQFPAAVDCVGKPAVRGLRSIPEPTRHRQRAGVGAGWF